MASVASPRETAVDDFVAKLKNRMDAMALTPRDLAKKAKVGYPYLYRVLKGEQAPSMDWAEKVGRHVGLHIRVSIEPRRKGA
jgi:predicted transcriptional regulator